jgi:hypothetical protein
MINDIAYERGSQAAWDVFTKTSGVPVIPFAKKALPAVTAAAKPVAAATPALKPAVVGGAAAATPAAATPAAPAASGGGWKGVAKDIGIQMAVPLGMAGIQKMMDPPTPPNQDPKAVI